MHLLTEGSRLASPSKDHPGLFDLVCDPPACGRQPGQLEHAGAGNNDRDVEATEQLVGHLPWDIEDDCVNLSPQALDHLSA